MKIFVCGDTHGTTDIHKLTGRLWPEGETLTKEDFLIILGDTGFNWSNNVNDEEDIELKRWFDEKPWNTLYICGNHQNTTRLLSITSQQFHGGLVRRVSDNIYHLARGQVFNFNGTKIFTMGGGHSIDKARRVAYLSWWPEELPSYSEMAEGLNILRSHNNEVDFILTHTCSNSTFEKLKKKAPSGELSHGKIHGEDNLRQYFQTIEETVKFKQWHFGHFHMDVNMDDRFFCHYNHKPMRII